MIGSQKHGTMGDNDNEGWPGYRIDQIVQKANNSLPLMPNLILINAGTNDVAQSYELDTADQRLGDLVDKILNAIPDAVVVVSTLLPSRNTSHEAAIEELNPKYIAMVQNKVDAGQRVYLADMYDGTITAEDVSRLLR